MARIPATMAPITTDGRVNRINHYRDLIGSSFNCDATGYSTKFVRCSCGVLYHGDICPSCHSRHSAAINDGVSVNGMIRCIEDIRHWFVTKTKTAMTVFETRFDTCNVRHVEPVAMAA